MGRVISFSEFEVYYSGLQKSEDFVRGTILDTNILISLTYEVKSNHEEITDFFDRQLLPKNESGFRLFSTVNTRAEFLDFNRRLKMTESLRDILEKTPGLEMTASSRAQIQYQSGLLKRREQLGSDPVFNDTQLKSIKAVFSAGRFSGKVGWLALCAAFLENECDLAERDLTELGVEYISQHQPSQSSLFHSRIDWPDAKRIAEKTCLSLSDAMILNAFQCSRFPFLVSSDFDIGYAVLASPEMKDVVMPDSVAKKYREFHFKE